MDYNNYYLLSDIPCEYFYADKDKKNRAMIKKIKRAKIEIYRCYRGYKWIKKSDYPKLMPFLTKPDYKNILAKRNYEAIIKKEDKLSIEKFKKSYDYKELYDKKKLEQIASDLRLKRIESIRRRFFNSKWTMEDSLTKPKNTHSKHGDYSTIKLPLVDEYGDYEGIPLIIHARALGLSSTQVIKQRIERGWKPNQAFKIKNSKNKPIIKRKLSIKSI